jgi:hypothetical protein
MKVDSISNSLYGTSLIQTQRISQTGNLRPQSQISGIQNQNTMGTEGISSTTGLTSAERAFFAKLFPNAASEINSHVTYSPVGVNSSVELGQIINRKV